ncbi:MAG: TIGR01620 family protein [Pseudomonadota bacterium]
MSEKDPARAPRAFSLPPEDGENAVEKATSKRRSVTKEANRKTAKVKQHVPQTSNDLAALRMMPDEAAQRLPKGVHDALVDDLTPPPPAVSKRGFRWSRLFISALFGLLALGMGLWVDQLIRDLFARQDWLGWLAVGLTTLLVLAAIVIVGRELASLRRLARVDGLRQDAEQALAQDDLKLARKVADGVSTLLVHRDDTALGRDKLAAHKKEIMDGSDLIQLAERDLMAPLDAKARALVMGSAKRVSIVTAVSPRALVDVSFVLIENARLIRRLAELYGGRPATLGFWRLARTVLGHLAVTGSIAVGDGLMQQVVGHGVAARISTRLGEGVVNGLLTARIGIAAMDVCRPLPFSAQHRPTVKDFMGELVSISGEKEK